MTSVTSFERVTAAIEGREPDRVPVIPQITYATAQLTGVSLVEALHSPEKTAEALLTGRQTIGYDAVYAGWESSFNLLAEAMGCTMRYPEGDVPRVVKRIVKKPDDIDKLAIPDPSSTGRLPIHMRTVELIKSEVGGAIPVFAYVPGPFTLAGQLCDVDQLLRMTVKDPGFIDALVEITTAASVRYAEANVDAGVDVVVVADPTASPSLISPKAFNRFAAPGIRTIFEAATGRGAVVSLHICGQSTPLLEPMCETGAQILELDHMVDLAKAKAQIGNRVCLQGNIDPAGALLTGTPDAVAQAARRCIDQAGAGGGFILSSGCEIPPRAPIANVRAMVQAAEQYGRYG
jgi:uroporphyrinogen decarboxylase